VLAGDARPPDDHDLLNDASRILTIFTAITRRSAPMTDTTLPTAAPAAPTLGEAFPYWLKLGFISFGGPAGQIAMMHTELVEKRRWISEHRFLHGLNYCMLLPGPEAIQLAIYIAWLAPGISG
jgi:chromate transporter